jgi:hypothetical protein
MRNSKLEQKLLEIYKAVYRELGIEFDDILEKDRDWWFLNYFMPLEKQEEILKKYLKWNRNTAVIRANYHLGCSPSLVDFSWRLTRLDDNLVKEAKRVKWIEFTEYGIYKQWFTLPAVGRSLILSPFSPFFTWQTTLVTEILKEERDYIEFKTENSHYKLERII